MKFWKITIWLVILLFAVIVTSTPHAQAASDIEKFPTSTTEIVAGWANPTNAYARDTAYATSSTDGAIQEYSGFGFNFYADDTIEGVWVKTKYYLNGTGNIGSPTIIYYISMWNESAFIGGFTDQKCFIFEGNVFIVSGWTEGDIMGNDLGLLISATALNNLTVRITSWFIDWASVMLSVDYLSVTVTYSTEGASAGPGTSESPKSWLQLPTWSEFTTGIQQDIGNVSQTLSSLWNDVTYSTYFKLLIVLSLLGGLGLLISRGRSKKKSERQHSF